MDYPFINTVLLSVMLVLLTGLATADVAIGLAVLTMLKGQHIIYSQMAQTIKEQNNLLQFIINSQRRVG